MRRVLFLWILAPLAIAGAQIPDGNEGRVEGTVAEVRNPNVCIGQGISGVRVELREFLGAYVGRDTTDWLGEFEFRGLEEFRTYRVRVIVPDGYEVREDEQTAYAGRYPMPVCFGLYVPTPTPTPTPRDTPVATPALSETPTPTATPTLIRLTQPRVYVPLVVR